MSDVTIYTKPGCPYCAAAKDDYRKRGVAFKEVDVPSTAGALQELMQLTNGQRRVPVILEDGTVTIGWQGGG